jgi:hypothetical protein
MLELTKSYFSYYFGEFKNFVIENKWYIFTAILLTIACIYLLNHSSLFAFDSGGGSGLGGGGGSKTGKANEALQGVFDTLTAAISGTWGKIFSIGLIAVAIMVFTRGGILFGFLMIFLGIIVPMIPSIIGSMGITF